MSRRYRICLMHPLDPRGEKVGGIETHVRLILSRHPDDFSVLLVGLDEIGDCRIGEVKKIEVDGRDIDFLPVARVNADSVNVASKTIRGSMTFRYALGLLRRLPTIRRLLAGATASADLQRYEFAMAAKALGLPTVQMVHNAASGDDKMDSLLKRYWFVQRVNEWLALHAARRILGVNDDIVARIARNWPKLAPRCEVMTVSVDTMRFTPTPFDCADGVYRLCFAGRLDEFKDPPLMFRVLSALRTQLGGRLEFHYVGATDPRRYAEYSAIEAFTIRHGALGPDAVAAVMRQCHAGLLTSFYEGMPCYLLEMLASGRPLAAIRLSQFDPLIIEGVSGSLIERSDPPEICASRLVDAFAGLWAAIEAGHTDPARIAALAAPYSIENQMQRLFARHRELQNAERRTAARSPPYAPASPRAGRRQGWD